jgi:S1-C subfamily serine protease
VDATVQLSIIVRGTVDGEEQLIWYAAGSGTIVSSAGLILTNNHLITPAGINDKLAELELQLASEGKEADLEVESEHLMVAISDGRHLPEPRYLAWVAASDPDLDLAVLRIDSGAQGEALAEEPLDLPYLPLGDSDALNLGDAIHIFGFPAIGAGSLTYTSGVVSGFLFEEEIDGTAWINTDAVTSGGNSGGSAINSAAELIGVPTSGSSLDCRAGDTNRDGVIGPDDVGCVPTGGSLTQLRPINLALPLLESVDASIAAEVGAGEVVTLTPKTDDLAQTLAAGQGCAARGDWRCAANYFFEAMKLAPEDGAIVGALYDAYLALGRQEASAGRLQSARTAFSSARSIDPTRTDAENELARIAPYQRAIDLDAFEGQPNYLEASDTETSSSYQDGRFVIEIMEPGVVTGYPLTEQTLEGQDYAALLEVASARGDGMITIEARTDPAGGQWVFGIDPIRQTWEILQFDAGEQRFMPWTGPFAYGPGAAPGSPATVELRVRQGQADLRIDGIDVAAKAAAALPEIGNQGTLSFGALMGSDGEEPFEVAYDAIGLYELSPAE